MPCPAPGDLPNPGIEPRSPALQADSLPSESPGKPCHLLHPSPLPSVFPSIRVFSNESALHIRWQKWGFSFSIIPSNEYSGLISFRIDWFDLLTAQGTLKSLLQHHRNTDGPYLRRNRHGSPKRLDPEHLATVLAKIPLYSLPFVA